MEEYRDDKKSKLYYMDEILHKISSMSQAENEKQLDDIMPSILKSVGKYTAADRAYIFEWSSEKKESFKNTFEWCASGIEPLIQKLLTPSLETDTESAESSRLPDAELGGNIYPEEKYHHL